MLNLWQLFDNCQANRSISRQVLQYNVFLDSVCRAIRFKRREHILRVHKLPYFVLADVVNAAYTNMNSNHRCGPEAETELISHFKNSSFFKTKQQVWSCKHTSEGSDCRSQQCVEGE